MPNIIIPKYAHIFFYNCSIPFQIFSRRHKNVYISIKNTRELKGFKILIYHLKAKHKQKKVCPYFITGVSKMTVFPLVMFRGNFSIRTRANADRKETGTLIHSSFLLPVMSPKNVMQRHWKKSHGNKWRLASDFQCHSSSEERQWQ